MAKVLSTLEPTTLEEVVNQKWQTIMNEEIESILQNDTWELVDLPEGKNPIDCRWIYKTKFHANNSIHCYEARLVAKDFKQNESIDYEDTFAHVANMTTVRPILALATQFNWPILQMDMKSAFLNGDLREKVYLKQPPRYVVRGK